MKKPICENCKNEIEILTEDDFGEPIDINNHWEQFLCTECHDKIWKELLDNACPQCRTKPCERGNDCWVNPFPRIMYLCYTAPRVKNKVVTDPVRRLRALYGALTLRRMDETTG
jgi:DNA-directed RNA polymerase subunit RPC12/RpoP